MSDKEVQTTLPEVLTHLYKQLVADSANTVPLTKLWSDLLAAAQFKVLATHSFVLKHKERIEAHLAKAQTFLPFVKPMIVQRMPAIIELVRAKLPEFVEKLPSLVEKLTQLRARFGGFCSRAADASSGPCGGFGFPFASALPLFAGFGSGETPFPSPFAFDFEDDEDEQEKEAAAAQSETKSFTPSASSASSSSSASSASGKPVHAHFFCDGCGAKPIVGTRWRCSICPNFDLCDACEQADKHPRDHPLLKFAVDESQREAVHYGVQCDQCGVSPIRGSRFKCQDCPNYDLCSKCEASHIASHILIKFRQPQPSAHGHGLFGGPHPFGGRGRCGRFPFGGGNADAFATGKAQHPLAAMLSGLCGRFGITEQHDAATDEALKLFRSMGFGHVEEATLRRLWAQSKARFHNNSRCRNAEERKQTQLAWVVAQLVNQ